MRERRVKDDSKIIVYIVFICSCQITSYEPPPSPPSWSSRTFCISLHQITELCVNFLIHETEMMLIMQTSWGFVITKMYVK